MSWDSVAIVTSNGRALEGAVADRFAEEDEARRRWLDARCAEERLRLGNTGRAYPKRKRGEDDSG